MAQDLYLTAIELNLLETYLSNSNAFKNWSKHTNQKGSIHQQSTQSTQKP